MIHNTLSKDSARRFYDFWGERYDWFSFYEARAKQGALEALDLQPGQRLLNVGLGTGKEHLLIQQTIQPGGVAFGLDYSPGMLAVAQERSGTPLCRADGGRLPFAGAAFDRLLCTYVLDLVPLAELPGWLDGFYRVLRPGGRMALLCLTEGVDLPSRAFVRMWKAAYAFSPLSCGGCRPLQLSHLPARLALAAWRQVIVQLGVPSELLVALRPAETGYNSPVIQSDWEPTLMTIQHFTHLLNVYSRSDSDRPGDLFGAVFWRALAFMVDRPATFVLSQIGHIPFNVLLGELLDKGSHGGIIPLPQGDVELVVQAIVFGLSAALWEELLRYVYRWWAGGALVDAA
jgi:demethylmenaquinone methyltransferase/2-methoxy-6-polyprenyl-1,4-benzoquinol methylase